MSLSTDDDGMLNDLAYSEGVSLSNCCEGGQIYMPKGSSAMQMSVPFSELNKSVRVIVDPDKKGDRFVVGNGMDSLEINPGKYLILENAVLSNNSVLLCVDTTTGSTGSFSIRENDVIDTDTITIKHYIESANRKYDSTRLQTTYDGQKYLSAGLFNFKTDKDNKTMELVSQTDLGKKMSMLSITNQIDDANYTEIKNIKVSTSCLASNTNIKKVKVDNMVTEIQTSAFSGDTSLEQVTLYDGNQLELIGANAFNGCANLTIFDFADNTAG
ncbi:MAG: leucine-rich repeat domain-containing protein [Mycoplasmoidaceae bacterium]|nr:leucine-rich repeat domain-containing protein [Mycoplasmoidaceae bacterium]